MSQFLALLYLRKVGESYSLEMYRYFSALKGEKFITDSGCNRTLWKLEGLGLVHSWEAPGKKGVPRRMYELTIKGEEALDDYLEVLNTVGMKKLTPAS